MVKEKGSGTNEIKKMKETEGEISKLTLLWMLHIMLSDFIGFFNFKSQFENISQSLKHF